MLFQAKPAVLDVVVCREANSRCPADEIPEKSCDLTMQIYEISRPSAPNAPSRTLSQSTEPRMSAAMVLEAGEPNCLLLSFWGTTDTEEKKKTDQQRIIKQQTNTDTREKHSTISQETMDSNSKKEFDEKTQTYKTGGSIEGGVGNLLSDTDIFSSAGGAPFKTLLALCANWITWARSCGGDEGIWQGRVQEGLDGWMKTQMEDWRRPRVVQLRQQAQQAQGLDEGGGFADASKWLNGENVGNVMDKQPCTGCPFRRRSSTSQSAAVAIATISTPLWLLLRRSAMQDEPIDIHLLNTATYRLATRSLNSDREAIARRRINSLKPSTAVAVSKQED
uniref:Uncharacterized protein n=1 Tax=Ditylenchus dipsaci TaxID=166011 RepID=A0A915CKS7_9BILA